MAELADALDSKSSVVTPRAGSSPAFGTKYEINASELSSEAFFTTFYIKSSKKMTAKALFINIYHKILKYLNIIAFKTIICKKQPLQAVFLRCAYRIEMNYNLMFITEII